MPIKTWNLHYTKWGHLHSWNQLYTLFSQPRCSCSMHWPVDADGTEVKDGGGAQHHVHGHQIVTDAGAKGPLPVLELENRNTVGALEMEPGHAARGTTEDTLFRLTHHRGFRLYHTPRSCFEWLANIFYQHVYTSLWIISGEENYVNCQHQEITIHYRVSAKK